jgi:succinate dehydrogenase / fumarate reductase cytochrome b subunit
MADNGQTVKFLNLLQIRFPATAYLSIGHRVSGVLLFLSIPLLIYTLELSLRNETDFGRLLAFLERPAVRWLLVLYVWVFAHHFLAGIRFLLLDMDLGVTKKMAQLSAWVVLVAGVVIMLAAAGCLL